MMRFTSLARKKRDARSHVRRVLQAAAGLLLASVRASRSKTARVGLFARAAASTARLRHMKRSVRCFIMWLLVLALPVQGFAASTMLLCGAGHHGMVQAAGGGHGHTSHMHMAGQDSSAGLESYTDGDTAESSAAHDGAVLSPLATKHAKAVEGKCTACAACCTVAFLPVSVIAFRAPAPSRVYPVVELTAHVGYVAAGLDRPPRFLLI